MTLLHCTIRFVCNCKCNVFIIIIGIRNETRKTFFWYLIKFILMYLREFINHSSQEVIIVLLLYDSL